MKILMGEGGLGLIGKWKIYCGGCLCICVNFYNFASCIDFGVTGLYSYKYSKIK